MHSFTDKNHLTAQSYSTNAQLNVRIGVHARYSVPQVDFTGWVLDQIAWRGDEVVLDVGCGGGLYSRPVRARAQRYIAGDLSFGMLRGLEDVPLRCTLDAQRLPFADGVADVLLANHMLYHVPDQAAAAAEFRRVLKPRGSVLVTTNSAGTMGELERVWQTAVEALGGTAVPPLDRPSTRFSLEEGAALLKQLFPHVTRHTLEGALVFPAPEPILAYLRSSKDWYMQELPAHISWNQIEEKLSELLNACFVQDSAFSVNKTAGVFVCSMGEQAG